MFKFIKRLFGGKVEEPAAPAAVPTEVAAPATTPEPVAAKPQRTKDPKGKFLADDPRTETNEAWVGGKAPAKKPRRPRNRKPSNKAPANGTPAQPKNAAK